MIHIGTNPPGARAATRGLPPFNDLGRLTTWPFGDLGRLGRRPRKAAAVNAPGSCRKAAAPAVISLLPWRSSRHH